MGLPQIPFGQGFACNKCNAHLDTLGYHARICKVGGDLTRRHNQIRDSICKACHMAGWNPRPEKPGLIANTNERPADIFILSLNNGKACAADVAVTHALPNKLHNECSTGKNNEKESPKIHEFQFNNNSGNYNFPRHE